MHLEYVDFPNIISDEDGQQTYIESILAECKRIGCIPLLSVQADWPSKLGGGDDGYTSDDVKAFGKWLANFDVRVIIRLNEAANGNW